MAEEILASLPQLTVCLCGLILHLLLFNGFIRDPMKCFNNSKTYLVVNLAAADSLVCLISFAQPFILYFMPYSWYDLYRKLALIFTMCTSVITISSISVDRYFMVVYPIRHRNVVTGKLMLLWIVCIWVIAAVYPIKLILAGEQYHDHIVANVSGVLIITLTATTCALTYSHLKKQWRNLRLENCTSSNNRSQEIRTLQELRFLNTIIIIASILIVFFIPLSTIQLVLTFRRNLKDSESLAVKIALHIFTLFYYLNFSVNPIIYALRLPNYQKTFSKLYWKKAN